MTRCPLTLASRECFLSPSSELSDESLPAGSGLFPTPTKKFDSKKHKAGTRKGLAIIAFVVLLAFYAVLLTLFILRRITLEELTALLAAFSGLQTLTAVAFAFYFAKS